MITVLRTQQLYIDMPVPGAEPWVNLIIQRVEMDDSYKVLNVVDRWGQVNARLSVIATQVYPLADPVPCPPGNISVAGIASALTTAAIDLIVQKYGGRFDPATGYIIAE